MNTLKTPQNYRKNKKELASLIAKAWKEPRWQGIKRPYTPEEVVKLSGSIYPHFDALFANYVAEKFWTLLEKETYIQAIGAMTGLQAIQQIEAGLKAIYLSGWQIAADANNASETYPDLSLYPVSSAPSLVKRIIKAQERRDQVDSIHNNGQRDWFAPIVADAEAGFGGPLNCFELIKALILAGAAAIHLEDQLSSLKKCGHMGGKVLVPVSEFKEKLISARLSADCLGASTILIARTDAESARYIRSDADAIDQKFITKRQEGHEGFFEVQGGLDYAIARSLAISPLADLLWWESSKPDLGEAKEFAAEIHRTYKGKWLAYNCSPSFHWKKHLSEKEAHTFQEKLAEMGYKFQFITLGGFHSLNASMFELAKNVLNEGMRGYQTLQEKEFELEEKWGYSAVKHQSFVGGGYFDEILYAVKGRESGLGSLKGSTEESQFIKS
jgi:isocitrate lyase